MNEVILRQQMLESVQLSNLQVDGVIAEISNDYLTSEFSKLPAGIEAWTQYGHIFDTKTYHSVPQDTTSAIS